jgi:hypothetical protein
MATVQHDKLVLVGGATPNSTKFDSIATLDLSGLEESLNFTEKMKVRTPRTGHVPPARSLELPRAAAWVPDACPGPLHGCRMPGQGCCLRARCVPMASQAECPG